MFVYFIDVNLKPKPKFYKHVFQVLPKKPLNHPRCIKLTMSNQLQKYYRGAYHYINYDVLIKLM